MNVGGVSVWEVSVGGLSVGGYWRGVSLWVCQYWAGVSVGVSVLQPRSHTLQGPAQAQPTGESRIWPGKYLGNRGRCYKVLIEISACALEVAHLAVSGARCDREATATKQPRRKKKGGHTQDKVRIRWTQKFAHLAVSGARCDREATATK